jgi:DNA-binding MarR family transcriptional regulator
MAHNDRHTYLMAGLLEGWDWFDNGLQDLVKAAGFRPLNKSQSMMVLYMSSGVSKPIEIARKMRLSRQAIRHISNQLVEMEIITIADNPDDGRSKILSFTERSSGIRSVAAQAIRDLEKTLRARIGPTEYNQLKHILNMDWGPVIKSPRDLRMGGNGHGAGKAASPAKQEPKPRRSANAAARRTDPTQKKKRQTSLV